MPTEGGGCCAGGRGLAMHSHANAMATGDWDWWNEAAEAGLPAWWVSMSFPYEGLPMLMG